MRVLPSLVVLAGCSYGRLGVHRAFDTTDDFSRDTWGVHGAAGEDLGAGFGVETVGAFGRQARATHARVGAGLRFAPDLPVTPLLAAHAGLGVRSWEEGDASDGKGGLWVQLVAGAELDLPVVRPGLTVALERHPLLEESDSGSPVSELVTVGLHVTF